jgi:hypothetical protein
LLIVLVSMAIGQPFTLQHARESVSPALWREAEFVRVNVAITAVWAAAFAAMAVIDLAFDPDPAAANGDHRDSADLVRRGEVHRLVPRSQARRVRAPNQRVMEGLSHVRPHQGDHRPHHRQAPVGIASSARGKGTGIRTTLCCIATEALTRSTFRKDK